MRRDQVFRTIPAVRLGCRVFPFVLAALFGGCSRYSPPGGGAVDDVALRRHCLAVIRETWPDSMRLSQRITVYAGRKRIDLVGYLAMRRADGWRAVAMGEMGGKFLDMICLDRVPRIAFRASPLPEALIRDGVMGDIGLGFAPFVSADARLFCDAGGQVVLVDTGPGGRVREFRFDEAVGRLAGAREFTNGRLVRAVTFDDWREAVSSGPEVPHRVIIRNMQWGYRLVAVALEWRGGMVDRAMLEADRP